MPRVIGIDPGSGSYDLCGLQDNHVFLDESIPTAQVADNPETLLELINSISGLDAVVAPSGYGLPLTRVKDLKPQDFKYLSLTRPADHVTVPELKVSYEKLLASIANMALEAYLLPGVVQLDTVPEHRKVNRIDMGTPDKLCAAALAVRDQANRKKIKYTKTSFILLELGFAYTAALAVEGGRIVDGIGGTSGMPGFLSMGAMDAELAYLLGEFGKDLLFEGGLASIVGRRSVTPSQLVSESEGDERFRVALDCYLEGLRKSVVALMVSVPRPREILISGRVGRIQPLSARLMEALQGLGEVRVVQGIASVSKESAQGAALIADGLAGGKYSSLVQAMRIRDASGTVLDHIYLPSMKDQLQLLDIVK